MRRFTRIGVLENDRRASLLDRYRSDVIEYFKHSEFGFLGEGLREDDVAKAARQRINMDTDDVCDVIYAAGISTTMTVTPPPAIGGYVQDVELVHNVFLLAGLKLPPQSLVDMVERAIGVYKRNRRAAIIRTFNPFFYLGLCLDAVASSPFLLASRLGLPGRKLQDSALGIIVQVVVYLAGTFASAIAILRFLGYLDDARTLFTRWFGI